MRHDLVTLKLFVAVAECGNLTRAADREHLAVSAVSKRIAELEDRLGTPLLLRLPRGVSLTPAGQAVLHHARRLLQQIDDLDADLAAFASGVKGHLRLSAVASALAQFLPSDLEGFLTTWPGVRISLEESTGNGVVLAVATGAADLGVIAEPTPRAGLVALPYRRDRLMLGVPVDHPLARRKAVRFAEALACPFVGPHADSSLARLMMAAARDAGRPLELRVQASSFDAMCRLVEAGLGITLLPDGVLAPQVEAGRIAAVALKDDWVRRELVVVIRPPAGPGHLARTLIDHLQRSGAPDRAAPLER